jgi:hypothetical protein
MKSFPRKIGSEVHLRSAVRFAVRVKLGKTL